MDKKGEGRDRSSDLAEKPGGDAEDNGHVPTEVDRLLANSGWTCLICLPLYSHPPACMLKVNAVQLLLFQLAVLTVCQERITLVSVTVKLPGQWLNIPFER